MQVNFNPQQNNQGFGMAIHSNEFVDKILKKRIKKPSEAERLYDVLHLQDFNDKVDITLFANKNNTLSANIHSKENAKIEDFFCKSYSENIFNKLFQSPVDFIETLAHIADKKAAKIKKQEEIAKKLGF